jgi:hypothetical protein
MRKGKLFALANQCAGHPKHFRREEAPKAIAASVLVRHFDGGYPLTLAYDSGFYGESPPTEPVEAMSADFWSEPFGIIEPEENNSAASPHFEPNEPPVVELEDEPGEVTPPPAVAIEPTPIPVPARADVMPVPQPQAEAQTILGDQELLADLRAIFQSPKTYEERPRPPAPEKEVPLKPSEHAIFDKIAQNMHFANAYDLGSYAMEQRLQQFDREIDAERRAAERQQSAISTPPAYPAPAPLPVDAVAVPPSEEIKDLEAIRSAQGEKSSGDTEPEADSETNVKSIEEPTSALLMAGDLNPPAGEAEGA